MSKQIFEKISIWTQIILLISLVILPHGPVVSASLNTSVDSSSLESGLGLNSSPSYELFAEEGNIEISCQTALTVGHLERSNGLQNTTQVQNIGQAMIQMTFNFEQADLACLNMKIFASNYPRVTLKVSDHIEKFTVQSSRYSTVHYQEERAAEIALILVLQPNTFISISHREGQIFSEHKKVQFWKPKVMQKNSGSRYEILLC